MKCKKCERLFKNRNALEQHLTSVRHNPLSDIKCVADAECKKRFNCPSAQLQHLETGRCVSGMTRAQLNAAIAANDTGGIITSGGVAVQLVLKDHPSATSTSQIRSPILTPTSTEFLDSYQSSAILTPTSTLSTSSNFDSMLTPRPRIRSPILTPTSTEFLDSYPPSAILTPTSTLSTSSNFDSMLTPRPRIRSPVLTPTSTEFLDSYPPSAILTPTSTLSTSSNFESMFTFRPPIRSDYQRCPLCPPSRTRTFKHGALQQHLSSSVHAQVSMSLPFSLPDEISFHCPRSLMAEGSKKKVVRQFSTVSGLAKHLESGACDGGKGTFRRVMKYVQKEMKDMGFDELKLLI